jgi:hypothetical protein
MTPERNHDVTSITETLLEIHYQLCAEAACDDAELQEVAATFYASVVVSDILYEKLNRFDATQRVELYCRVLFNTIHHALVTHGLEGLNPDVLTPLPPGQE